MRDSDKVIPIKIDLDADPKGIEGGAVRLMQNARGLDITKGKKYVITSVQGNEYLEIENTAGEYCSTQGKCESLSDDSVYYFVTNDDPVGRTSQVILWYKDGEIQVILDSDIAIWTSVIHSVQYNAPYLIWTTEEEQQKMLDVVRCNRTDKKLEMYVYFGVPDTNNDVFVVSQEYYFSADDNAGNPLYNTELILNCDGTYTNDIPTGIATFVTAFNASPAAADYVAEGCTEGRVKITEKVASGTNTYKISTMEITTAGGTNPSPVLLSYPNIYVGNVLSDGFYGLAHYAPALQPLATYQTDSNVTKNYVNQSVWQFAYRYIYDDDTHSVLSPISNIAIPNYNGTSDFVDNYVDIQFNDANLKNLLINRIEYVALYVRQFNEGQWQLIDKLPLSQIGTARQFYKWYNTELLLSASQVDLIKPFESVPFRSETLTIASEQSSEGSRLFLGNNEEGYNNICGDFDINVEQVELEDIPSKTGNVEVKIRIKQIFSSGERPEQQCLYWDGERICFGGIGQDWVNQTGGDYGQNCPEGGFCVYAAGTNNYAITKQIIYNPIPSSIAGRMAFYDLEKGILDGSTVSKRSDIYEVLTSTSTEVYQLATITNLRHGSYIIRVASHYCTVSGEYRGDLYKIDESLGYQTTSTYIFDSDLDTVDSPTLTPTFSFSKREWVVDIEYDTTTIVTHYREFVLLDLTDPQDLYASRNLDGYAYRGNENRPLGSLRIANAQGGGGYTSYFWTIQSRTDHNGFLFAAFSKLAGASTVGYDIFNVFDDGNFAYEVDANAFAFSILSANPIKDLFDTEKTTHVIFPDYQRELPQNTKTVTVTDGYLVPIKDILLLRTRIGVWAKSGNDGVVSITYVLDPTVGEADFAFGQTDLADVNFEEYTNAGGTFPNTFPIPDVATTVKFDPTSSMPLAVWKNGGGWNFRVVYYDNRSRVVGATENFVAQSTTLLIDDTDIQVLTFSINHLPPQEAYSYQFVRSLNAPSYWQIVIDKPIYYSVYISIEEKTETSFQAGNAREIWVSLKTITEFNKNVGGTLGVTTNSDGTSTLGYEWQQGDTLSLIRNIVETDIITPNYVSLPITKQVGDYIVIKNDFGLPELTAGYLIQITRPLKTSPYENLYQFGEAHLLVESGGIFYHGKGYDSPYPTFSFTAQDQTASLPATGVFIWGDTWRYQRTMNTTVEQFQPWVYNVESESMSDFYKSDDQYIGRTFTFDANSIKRFFPSSVRFSNTYKPNTFINGYGNFETTSQKLLPPYAGGISKLEWTGDVILALCEIRAISMYIGVTNLKDNAGSNLLSLTDSVLPNYNDLKQREGKTSGCRHPLSVINTYGGQVYWYDALSGVYIQYSSNALFPASDVGVATEFSKYKKLNKYDIKGAFDRRYSEVVVVVKLPSNASKTYAYNVRENVWVSLYSFHPEILASVSERLISFVAGQLWEHEKGDQLTFYGTVFPMEIHSIHNKGNSYQKRFLAMDIECKFEDDTLGTFSAPKIYSRQSDLKIQESELAEADFEIRENAYKAPFLRDINSGVDDPLIQGDMLKGYWIEIQLSHSNTAPMTFYASTVYFTIANPTNK